MQCPRCESKQVRKNGHRRGKQNYRCKDCDRQFIETYSPKGYSQEIKQICLRMYGYGMGLRKIEQLTGVSHSTINNWVKQANDLQASRENSRTVESSLNQN